MQCVLEKNQMGRRQLINFELKQTSGIQTEAIPPVSGSG
jgi:hypothetical protein